MKKKILVCAFAIAVGFAQAQEITSKNGMPVLPESGDWSIGFDAVPVLKYFGNMFNNDSGNTVSANFPANHPMMLVGKWVRENNVSWLGKLRIGMGSSTVNTLVDNLSQATPDSTNQVTDAAKTSWTNIALGFGIEKSRGKGRVRGNYGAEACFGLGSSGTTMTYGNAITSTNPVAARPTEVTMGSTVEIGIRGFVGIEYFFAPKMSIGAEYGWGFGMSSTGQGTTSWDTWDSSSSTIKAITTHNGGSSSWGLDVDNAYGSIMLSFYF